MRKKARTVLTILAFSLSLSACGARGEQEVRQLDYTVVKEWEIPQELATRMEEKKEQGYRLSYLNDEYLYIAYGMGKQNTSGYSLTVTKCEKQNNILAFSVKTAGPAMGTKVEQQESFPSIVIKTEAVDLPVVFE